MPAIRKSSRSPRQTPISNQNWPVRMASANKSYDESADWGSDLTSGDEFGEATTREPLKNITQASPKQVKSAKGRKSNSKKSDRTICIQGVELETTVVLDTFWYFAAERNAIDERRRAQKPWPWTEDKILRDYSFCNSYRILDKTSQYIIREVIEKGDQHPVEMTFRVVLFNLYTKMDTWEILTRKLGTPHLTWKDYDHDKYARVLTGIKEGGGTIYTGAFQKPFPSFHRREPSYANHLILLETFMENELAYRLLNAKYLVEVYEWLISFASMGEFNTYQLMLNLLYSPVLNFSGNDFVVPGLGAISGMQKIFGPAVLRRARESIPEADVAIIRWFQENQDTEFKRLGLTFNGLGPDHLPLDLADIEHLLCEVDKYSRKRHPGIKGNDRTEIKAKYTPHDRPYPSKPTLPKAWKHPDRKRIRISPRGPIIEKRYVVRELQKHRTDSKGQREYYVIWEGYAPKYDTWEPESSLLEDAPKLVAMYKKKYKLK